MSFEELSCQEVGRLGSFYGLVEIGVLINYPEAGLSMGIIEAVLGHLETCPNCQKLLDKEHCDPKPVRLVSDRPSSPDDETLATPTDQDPAVKWLERAEEIARVSDLAGENHPFNLIRKIEWALRYNKSTREGMEIFLKHLKACISA